MKSYKPRKIVREVRPKKNLGQHFLTDLGIAQRIADTVNICPELPVLEIGPGMGVMTQYLKTKNRPFKAVEIDRESATYLTQKWPELENSILREDFLRMNLNTVFDGQCFVLTGNYPYDISSQIFFKMLEYKNLIPCCTGMIQKEMAERITAPPKTKSYGVLSVFLQRWYNVNYLFTVEPEVFNPPPKVRSAVISMQRNEIQDCGCNEELFRKVVKGVFGQRRKMLRVSLKALINTLESLKGKKKDHSIFLAQEEFTQRPEDLSVEDFVDLTNRIEEEIQY